MYIEKYIQLIREHNPDVFKNTLNQFETKNDVFTAILFRGTSYMCTNHFEAQTPFAAIHSHFAPFVLPGLQLHSPVPLGNSKVTKLWFPDGFSFNFNGEYGLYGYPEYGFIELKHPSIKWAYLMPVRIPDINRVFKTFYPEIYAQYAPINHRQYYMWIYSRKRGNTIFRLAHTVALIFEGEMTLKCKPKNLVRILAKRIAEYEKSNKVNADIFFINRALSF